MPGVLLLSLALGRKGQMTGLTRCQELVVLRMDLQVVAHEAWKGKILPRAGKVSHHLLELCEPKRTLFLGIA